MVMMVVVVVGVVTVTVTVAPVLPHLPSSLCRPVCLRRSLVCTVHYTHTPPSPSALCHAMLHENSAVRWAKKRYALGVALVCLLLFWSSSFWSGPGAGSDASSASDQTDLKLSAAAPATSTALTAPAAAALAAPAAAPAAASNPQQQPETANSNPRPQSSQCALIPAGEPAKPQKDVADVEQFKDGFSSGRYWETRYANKGNSGTGSYDKVAEFKAKVLNEFVAANEIKTVAEFGFGDGNQLSLAKYPQYYGFDVSPSIWQATRKKFEADPTKNFFVYESGTNLAGTGFAADLVISLDVIYHLVEDQVFDQYMHSIFSVSGRYVVVFSPNFYKYGAAHVKFRRFVPWVKEHFPEFQLVGSLANPLPGEAADFFFFDKGCKKQ